MYQERIGGNQEKKTSGVTGERIPHHPTNKSLKKCIRLRIHGWQELILCHFHKLNRRHHKKILRHLINHQQTHHLLHLCTKIRTKV